jgi:nicotinamide-nucleotide amidase
LTAELISIGDELLIGQVVNTNASWLGQRFSDLGVTLTRVVTIGDDRDVIRETVDAARQRAEVVIVTGGLGPTHDDITKEAVASLFGAQLILDQGLFDALKARYDRVGRTMSPSNRTQAEVPEGFSVLRNRWGSAPGLLHEDGCLLLILPGVPREMKGLIDEHVVPRLLASGVLSPSIRKTLLTTGVGESRLHDDVGEISPWTSSGAEVAYLPSVHGVRVRLTAPAGSPDVLAGLEAHLRAKAGRHVYGEGEETIEAVVGQQLRQRGWTVATAESATGGLVASRLTDVPGASAYVRGGVVAYDNEIKTTRLGVLAETLSTVGAVSQEVVEQMARGVCKALGSDCGIATSGIMGPGGGSDEKPVGTVWIAVCTPGKSRSIKVVMHHDRLGNKARTATTALDLLRRAMLTGA